MRQLSVVLILVGLALLGAGCESYSPVELTATAAHSTEWATNTDTPPMDDPTPTQEGEDEYCFAVPTEAEGFQVLNDNNCLVFPAEDEVSAGPFDAAVTQWLPLVGGYQHYNWLVTIDQQQDPNCTFPEILWDLTGYVVHHGKTCGYHGWFQRVETEHAACHIIKVTGYADIIDPDWPEKHTFNYGIFASVVRHGGDGVTLPVYTLTENGPFEAPMTVYFGASGDYLIRFGLLSAYATAEVDSTVRIETMSFAWDVDGDHCHGNTPGL